MARNTDVVTILFLFEVEKLPNEADYEARNRIREEYAKKLPAIGVDPYSVRYFSNTDELSDWADGIKKREYRETYVSLADEIIEEIKSGNIETSEQLYTAISESVENSVYIIWTSLNFDVIKHSDNAGAFKELGADGIVDRHGDVNWSAIAFSAMEADVTDYLRDKGVDFNDPSSSFEDEDYDEEEE